MVARDGTIVATNAAWKSAHRVGHGSNWSDWCHEIHSSTPALCRSLEAGLQAILEGSPTTFVQDCRGADRPHRTLVSPCPEGALVLHEALSPAPTDPQVGRQVSKMEVVGRLTGGVAHDFANLLTLISGYTDLLLGRIGEHDPLRPELAEIRNAAARGSRLTAQLLGFTRGQSTDPRPVDLNAMIRDLERMLRPILGEHVELDLGLSPNIGNVIADPGQLEQVLMNLILNARDAVANRGRIVIETSEGEMSESTARLHGVEPGRFVMLSVRDNGHGIEPDVVERVFEPFFTTKEHGKGTGLGLSTVHGIVKQLGGDIWVRSTPGEGTCFTICLPRARYVAEEIASASERKPQTSGGETILLVEDEEGVRRLLAYVLIKNGYRVIEAPDGEQALHIFMERAADIDLVLTDMVMPGMTGSELADHLLELRPELKLMFMSGYTDDVLLRTGALRPDMSFVQKPLRPEVLAAKVRETLDSPSRPFNPR
jgi:two-component system cell cycle sensor histidine kinase/response regulator CckA